MILPAKVTRRVKDLFTDLPEDALGMPRLKQIKEASQNALSDASLIDLHNLCNICPANAISSTDDTLKLDRGACIKIGRAHV